jgi:starch phosphorylase
MTYLGLFFSRYINAVSLRHQMVSQEMYPQYTVNSITNGVHVGTWSSEHFKRLFDRYTPGWRRDNSYLRQALGIPLKEILAAHARAKRDLLAEVAHRTGRKLDPNAFTIGFARRATAYKRGDMLFGDMERLVRMRNRVGPIQVVYAGKAHPHDGQGKALIRRTHEASEALRETIPVVYLEDYDMRLGGLLTSGADLWLNTPQKPLEASGTSGMKAAINGVPSLSTLDGWWLEGHIEGVTGWAIGNGAREQGDLHQEMESLYSKLENQILPLFFHQPDAYAEVMRSAIAVNGSFFTAQRMAWQYLVNAYRTPSPAPTHAAHGVTARHV